MLYRRSILSHRALDRWCKHAGASEAAREATVENHEELLRWNAIQSFRKFIERHARIRQLVDVDIDGYEPMVVRPVA
jgi:hypothetical protein